MGKLFRLRDYVLIGAGLAGEAFEEIRLVHGLFPAALKAQYGFVPAQYRRTSYLSMISQLLLTGDITRTVDANGKVYLQLTSVGKTQFVRKFPLLAMERKRWDGFFMVVIFDIPEKERKRRDSLRDKLIQLGFGMLQESVWISPYHLEEDVREFLILNSFGDFAFVLYAKKLWAGNFKELAQRVWNLNKIGKLYSRVVRYASLASKASRGEGETFRKKAYRLYLETLATDPLLPKELLPENWTREQAIKSLNRISAK